MAPLGALSQAWVSADSALPLGRRLVGPVRRERALRLRPALSHVARPDWSALAEDETLVLYDACGASHYQALNKLAIKLAELRGSASDPSI